MQDGLPLDGFFDRAHPIADPRGLLELQARRVILHQVAHLAEQLEIFSFEQHLRRVQMAAVLIAIDRQTARPEASLDLVFEARPRAIAEHRVCAGAQRKDFTSARPNRCAPACAHTSVRAATGATRFGS